ncbi:MAG: hypothetical protein AB7G23_03020 [Vicinamibacterales bacterium]
MAQRYEAPALPSGVAISNLVPEDSKAAELTPHTSVLVINRGRKPLHDKYDGRDYQIGPGYHWMPYGAALHFQRRAIIPGTKNLELGGWQSWLGILGVDGADLCEPLSDEELRAVGERVEAIDRHSFSSPEDQQVTTVSTGAARAVAPGQGMLGGPRRPQLDAGSQATPEASARAAEIMTPPATSATAEDEAAAGVAPRPRAMRGRG